MMTKRFWKKIACRAFVIFTMPFVLVWVIIERTWSETRSIPSYIWYDIKENIHAAHRAWDGHGLLSYEEINLRTLESYESEAHGRRTRK